MSDTATIEKARTVKFFNVKNPGITIMVKQDPETFKPGANPALAQDKYADFHGGWFETSDPEIIEALNSPKLRAKGVRCADNAEDMAEYGSVEERRSWMEREVERRAALRAEELLAERAHAARSPFEESPVEATESVAPAEGDE